MKKQSIYFLVIIILLVQTSCQQNNEEEDFFNNQITLLENNPRLYLSKIDSTQVTNLNNSKEATHFLLVSLANYYVNNYYPPKEVLQKSIHIFTKKKLIQQQLESLLFLAKTYKKEKNLKMEVQAIEKAIDIASQIEDKEWLCCLYGYIYNEHISFIEESKEQYETISSTSNTTFGYYFFSNIGYRYISTKGFLFRIGLSPSFSFNDKHGITKEPFIYPYISFGYSF